MLPLAFHYPPPDVDFYAPLKIGSSFPYILLFKEQVKNYEQKVLDEVQSDWKWKDSLD